MGETKSTKRTPLAPKSESDKNADAAAAAAPQPDKKPAGKKRKSAGGDEADAPSKKQKKPAAAAKTRKAADDALDVSGVTFEDEEDGRRVPVYETCDSMRRKIRDLLKQPGMTQAGLCRALAKHTAPDGKKPTTAQLSRFMDKKGPMKGNTSPVFYTSYVLLEKMRIRDGKPKSKFRTEMEEKHEDGGVELDRDMDAPLLLHFSETAYVDRWGSFHIEKKPSFS